MILIGSRALKQHYPDLRREPKDWDWVVADFDVPKTKRRGFEYHASPGFAWLLANEKDVASPDALYTIKMSHCFWNIFWEKTMSDIVFLRSHGAKIIQPLFDDLYAAWTVKHGDKKAYLKVDNEKFFTSAVKRTYVHDDLHRMVAYKDRPMFEYVKKDMNKAFIDKDLFNILPHDDKLILCREEIYVTALERFLIPSEFRYNSIAAYRGACRLLVTSMTKGWFPRFIVDNWEVLGMPEDKSYKKAYREKLKLLSPLA